MDFNLSEEQEMLKEAARDFLAAECPKSRVRELLQDEKGYSPEMWRKMAGLGWIGLVFPEEYGGTGGSFLDLTVLLEEMGRARLPSPFFATAVLGGFTILEAGSDKQKKELLPQIAKGEKIVTLALNEAEGSYSPAAIQTRAAAQGDSYIIDGTKLFVPDAQIADYLICAARTASGTRPEEGITLFLVDAKSPGIRYTVLKTIDDDKQSEVAFKGVKVPRENILGQVNKGWPIVEKVLQKATVAKCAEAVGGAQQVLEMTVAYAKERVQFGQPIGSFQAVQHHCANMVTDVDGCRYITYEAAWMLSEGLPCAKEVAMAKAWVSDAYIRITDVGHQVIGGVSVVVDHDMPFYSKGAKAMQFLFGDADFHREIVAREMGL